MKNCLFAFGSKIFFSFFVLLVTIILSSNASAQVTVPRSADAGRFDIEKKQTLPTPPEKIIPKQEVKIPAAKAPENAKTISFKLNQIIINGNKTFSSEELEALYKKYLGQQVTLATVWQITDLITKYYQEKGYFLSRAYVPAQEISKNGVFTINVVEGYVESVELNDSIANNYIVKSLIKKIKKEKPLNIKTLESFTLRINDTHSGVFRSVIEPLKETNNENDGAVRLVVTKEKEKISGSITADNYNSMYTGPFQSTVNLRASLLPQNQTSLSWVNSMPLHKLRSVYANHNIVIMPGISMDIYAGYTESYPGYTLSSSEIESDSSSSGASINYQPIRQRQENLVFKLKLDSKDVATDLQRTKLTRDHIRALRFNVAYDRNDFLNGYNFINTTYSKGISAFDASERGDANLSRVGVDSRFQKLEFNWNRFQNIGNWTGITSTAMQFANGAQYSSEQIGYGGEVYGRAYDPSDIVGDQGMLAAFELRYMGLPSLNKISIVPFGFYDVGKVWSVNDVAASRSSTGGGIHIDSEIGVFGNFTVAQPLIHKIATPPYGNGKNPHILAQLGVRF